MRPRKHEDSKTRQTAYRERMRERGFRQKTFWINEEDYHRGIRDAQIGHTNASEPPPGVDRVSWMLGYAEVLENRSARETEA